MVLTRNNDKTQLWFTSLNLKTTVKPNTITTTIIYHRNKQGDKVGRVASKEIPLYPKRT